MRVLQILKTLINFLFIIYTLVYISMIFLCIYFLCFEHEIPSFLNIKINNLRISHTNEITETGKAISFFITYFIVLSLTLGSLFFLRKFVHDIKPRNIFTQKQTHFLKRIGQCIVGATLAKFIFTILWKLYFNITNGDLSAEVYAEMGLGATDLFGNEFFIICIGLFFLFLSKLFSIAQRQKEENDLTI